MTNADVKIATVTIITEIAVFMGKELLIFLIKDTEDCSIHLPVKHGLAGFVDQHHTALTVLSELLY